MTTELKGALKCPTCRFSSGIRVVAETNLAALVSKEGEIMPQDGEPQGSVEPTGRLFCGNCGSELEVKKLAVGYGLAVKTEAEVLTIKA